MMKFTIAAMIRIGLSTVRPREYPCHVTQSGTCQLLPIAFRENALALARSLVEAGGYDIEQVLAAYVRWYETPPFDIGQTTLAALAAASRAPVGSRRSHAIAAASRSSQANGSLMRISPLGIAAAGEPGRAAGWAAEDSRLTHPHPVCVASCAAFAAAVAGAIAGASRREMLELASTHAGEGTGAGEVRDMLDTARHRLPGDFQSQMGWVRTAFVNAFHLLANGIGVEEGLIQTVGRGGDTDTNGAIAGALLGAADGRSAVPQRWIAPVLACRPDFSSGAARPRPPEYWPHDVLELAVQLLCLAGDGNADKQ